MAASRAWRPAAAWPRGIRTRGGPLVYPPVIQPRAVDVDSVGGAHGPESGEHTETLQPEPALSRAWPAPTEALPVPTAGGASTGGYTRGALYIPP